MGLDMFARVTAEKIAEAVDFEVRECRDLHRWRKRYDLHVWMMELYYEKGGAAEDFIDVTVLLTAGDIDRLAEDIRADDLPDTSALLGAVPGGHMEEDLVFIAKARKALQEGLTLYYTAS